MPIRARPQPALALLAALAVLAPVGQAGARANLFPTLYVDYVGTNCTFTLANDAGAPVAAIAPGTYQLTLTATDFESCGSGLPDFQLAGPGVLVQSPIDNGTGAAANYTVTFQPSSTYVAQDLNQPLSRITFTTQAAGAPPLVSAPANPAAKTVATSTSSSPVGSRTAARAVAASFRGTLEGAVSPAGKATLLYRGQPVTQLAAGRYTLVVADHSAAGGFLIQQPPGLATPVTGVAFVGTRRLTIVLSAGQALFYPSFLGAKSYFIVVNAR